MNSDAEYNSHKTDFANVHVNPDPSSYFDTMEQADYKIPQESSPVFGTVIETIGKSRAMEPLSVLDVGCSYGINAALLRYNLSLRQLYLHCNRRRAVRSQAIADRTDREFFRPEITRSDIKIAGLDVSKPAVDYAVRAGLLDGGMVISTGCIGYVTTKGWRTLATTESIGSTGAVNGH